MALEIFDINTSKKEYIFGEDKDIQLNFKIKSTDKEYSLNSVYIDYGISVLVDGKELTSSYPKRKIIKKSITINQINIEEISCNIPINYPNTKKSEYSYRTIELLNYIRIIADIKFNPFTYKKEYFPKITVKDSLLDFGANDNNILNSTLKQMQRLIKITDEINNERIKNEQKILGQNYVNGLINKEEYEINKGELNEEGKKYYIIENQQKYDELSKLSKDYTKQFIEGINKNELFIKKGDTNYIKIKYGGQGEFVDYFSKDFYEYVYNNYFLFRLIEIIKKNIFIKIIYGIILFFIIYIFILFYFGDNKNIESIKNFLHIKNGLVFMYVFISQMLLLIPYILIRQWGRKYIENKIIEINFQKKKIIKQKYFDRTLVFDDIFSSLKINYDKSFYCNFDVNLNCVLKVAVVEGSGKQARIVYYDKIIYSIRLGEYGGEGFDISKIIKFKSLTGLDGIIIKPGYVVDDKWLSEEKAIIEYRITYSFTSRDIVDKSDYIILE